MTLTTLTRALGAAALLGVAACAHAQTFEEAPAWQEAEVPEAPAFDSTRLLGFEVSTGSELRYGIDPNTLSIGPDAVEVITSGGGLVFHAHPYWVRLGIERGGERISLASSGRQVRVGDFLGPAERRELADTLQDLLAAASGRNR